MDQGLLAWVSQELALGVRGTTIAASFGVLLLCAAIDLTMRALVRRKLRRDEAEDAGRPDDEERSGRYWFDQALAAGVPPLALLVWVHGLYAALVLIIAEVDRPGVVGLALDGLLWIRGVATLSALVWLLLRLSRVLEARLTDLSARAGNTWEQALIPLAGRTIRRTLPLVALILGIPMLAVSPETQLVLSNAVSLLLIAIVAMILFQLAQAAEALLLGQYRLDVADNLQARKVYTQVTVLKKVAFVGIGIFTLASMLMVFDSVRQFGTSILASAGIAGIILGFAAQRSLATLLAGFQIAVTQPIRIDDVVIVEDEWGRIEDITLTYVTIRIWDLRRLIVPITYFIERPFQNWTRTSAELLASVVLHVDYTAPLGPLRDEFGRILDASPYWDGKVKVLQVTEARERSLEVRALASARDAPTAWDLRCEVREKLIHFLQQRYPDSLPRVRAEVDLPARDLT